MADAPEKVLPSGFDRGMALTAALLGWMFDGAEMGVFSLVGRSAVGDLLRKHATAPVNEGDIGLHFGVIVATFLIGAATGGVVFGWLGDCLGRVKAMSLSVLTFTLFTGLCGLSDNFSQLVAFRFLASLGLGGEWSLGVALVMEVWPNQSRATMAGLIGAAANGGFLLIGLIGIALSTFLESARSALLGTGFSVETVDWLVANQGWRLMMLLCVLPAALTLFFRVFVPESARWEADRAAGHTSHWAAQDLLAVAFGLLGPVLLIGVWWQSTSVFWRAFLTPIGLLIALLGYLYPVRQYVIRATAGSGITAEDQGATALLGGALRRMLLGACLSGIPLLATWGAVQWAPSWAGKLTDNQYNAREWTQVWSSLGAIIGTVLAAYAGDWMGRRWSYRLFCLLSMASVLGFYQLNREYNFWFGVGAFFIGGCTATFYGWLPLYLPELFPSRLRATGQGFSFNFGRTIAAIGALQVGAILSSVAGWTTWSGVQGGYPVACSFAAAIYLVGLVAIQFAPETANQALPE